MEETIAIRLASMVLTIFVIVACIAFSKWRDLLRERKLHKLVAWSATTNYRSIGSVRPGLDLIDYIDEVSIRHKLPKKYSITGEEERKVAKDILKEYQRVLTQEYFNGMLSCPKTNYADDGEHYFFAKLFEFLSSHECDHDFLGNEMLDERLTYKEHRDGSGYTATYRLSAFGNVFYKLYYISFLFCKDSPIYGERFAGWMKTESFTDVLDSRQVTFIR